MTLDITENLQRESHCTESLQISFATENLINLLECKYTSLFSGQILAELLTVQDIGSRKSANSRTYMLALTDNKHYFQALEVFSFGSNVTVYPGEKVILLGEFLFRRGVAMLGPNNLLIIKT